MQFGVIRQPISSECFRPLEVWNKTLLGYLMHIAKTPKVSDGQSNDKSIRPSMALEASGDARYADAFSKLAQAREHMQLAKGGPAALNVFEHMTNEIGIRICRLDQTEAILDDRRAKRARLEDGYTAAHRSLTATRRGVFDAISVPAQ